MLIKVQIQFLIKVQIQMLIKAQSLRAELQNTNARPSAQDVCCQTCFIMLSEGGVRAPPHAPTQLLKRNRLILDVKVCTSNLLQSDPDRGEYKYKLDQVRISRQSSNPNVDQNPNPNVDQSPNPNVDQSTKSES